MDFEPEPVEGKHLWASGSSALRESPDRRRFASSFRQGPIFCRAVQGRGWFHGLRSTEKTARLRSVIPVIWSRSQNRQLNLGRRFLPELSSSVISPLQRPIFIFTTELQKLRYAGGGNLAALFGSSVDVSGKNRASPAIPRRFEKLERLRSSSAARLICSLHGRQHVLA